LDTIFQIAGKFLKEYQYKNVVTEDLWCYPELTTHPIIPMKISNGCLISGYGSWISGI
jgi:hypothetical protein